MRTLRNWTAKRAGGRITVYGYEDRGDPRPYEVRVPHVDTIKPHDGRVVATNKDGEAFELAL